MAIMVTRFLLLSHVCFYHEEHEDHERYSRRVFPRESGAPALSHYDGLHDLRVLRGLKLLHTPVLTLSTCYA